MNFSIAQDRRKFYLSHGLRKKPRGAGSSLLLLMKLDSARGIDQGDLTRMLGRVDPTQLAEVVAIVEKHSKDPQAADDVQQYALLGRMEWEINPHKAQD